MQVKTISAGRGDCSEKNEVQFVKIGACIWSGEQFLWDPSKKQQNKPFSGKHWYQWSPNTNLPKNQI